MNKVREVLRMNHEGISDRGIARSLGVHRKTVARYLAKAEAKGLNWMTIQGMSEDELEDQMGSVPENKAGGVVRRVPDPDWAYIHTERKKRHVTLALLWEEYKAENPTGYQYSWFSELYCNWRERLNISMRQDHLGGEKLFVDYSGDGFELIERSSGAILKAELFVAVWGASNYTYAEATLTQSKQDWIMSHVRAFEYFGCVPHVVVPDNLKSGVTKACRYEPDMNRTYLEVAQHYGFVVIPGRPGHAKDKAKVEAGVLLAQRWILASLRGRKFYSIDEINEAVRELLKKINTRPMRKLKKSRLELFEELDKPKAVALVDRRYEYAQWAVAKIGVDYHVEADDHYYSVPYTLRQECEYVDVRLSERTIEIFRRGERIASHERSFVKHKHSTLDEHRPASHRQYLAWNPERIRNWAQTVGPCTRQMVQEIMDSRKYPEQGYRSCLGLLRLAQRYSAPRLENACKRALSYKIYSYKRVRDILERKLDEQADLFGQQDAKPSIAHENIRGKNYYETTEETMH